MCAKLKKHYDHLKEVQIEPDDPVFTTGVVCRLLNIPVWVLKQLDAEEIVSPPRESEGQARLYSIQELELVQHCWVYMKTHKVKVPGLKIILKLEEGTFEGP